MELLERLGFRKPAPASDLDQPLLCWGDDNAFTVRNACENVAVFGKTGSGKSSGSGDTILRALVRHANSGGLILASKPGDREYVRRIFREERDERDLLIMEPGAPYRFNVLDFDRKNGADTRQLTQALMTFGETLDRAEGESGGDRDPFWIGQNRRQIHNAIEIVTAATGAIDPRSLQAFIGGAALNLEETGDAKWHSGFHCQALLAAKAKAATDIEKNDFDLAEAYWISELPALNDRTRSSINAGVMGLLHVFNTGIVRDLLATSTNISPESLEERKWWLVNFPIVPGDASATFVNTAIKYAVQRHILRRKAGAGDPLLAIWCDEFQKVSNSYDAAFLAECRSHKGCLVALTQSIHSMYANLRGKGGEHQTDSLLTNFGHLIIHTLGDAKSAEYASSILGKRRELFIGTSTGREEMWDVITGQSRMTMNAHESYEPVLQPAMFLRGLRTGGPPDNTVDGVVIKAGQPFRNGENYLIAAFGQR
jgi:type IV secretory pathway TraG/TraD family ATPase VirD4